MMTNSEDGRNVLTSAEFLNTSHCEPNQCEKSALFTQQEADRAEESQWQGRRNLTSACSIITVSLQRLQKYIFNITTTLNSFPSF